jgi:hypothetical protein
MDLCIYSKQTRFFVGQREPIMKVIFKRKGRWVYNMIEEAKKGPIDVVRTEF